MLPNEKQFDEQLSRLGELYEEGKDCLSNLPIAIMTESFETAAYWRLREILTELRDIAAVNLKIVHQIKDN